LEKRAKAFVRNNHSPDNTCHSSIIVQLRILPHLRLQLFPDHPQPYQLIQMLLPIMSCKVVYSSSCLALLFSYVTPAMEATVARTTECSMLFVQCKKTTDNESSNLAILIQH
jgi:hypothetical protein